MSAPGKEQTAVLGSPPDSPAPSSKVVTTPQVAVHADHPLFSLVLSSTGHNGQAWQANIDSFARFVEDQYPEIWESMLALRAAGVKSSDKRFNELVKAAYGDVYWYDLANKAKLP